MPPLLTQTLATMGLKAEQREFDRMAALLTLLPPTENLLSTAARTLDASALDSSAVRKWLLDLPIDHDEVVWVGWPWESVATQMAFELFVNHYDDLWYPAQDELLVVTETPERSRLVVLDHEERFALIELGLTASNGSPRT